MCARALCCFCCCCISKAVCRQMWEGVDRHSSWGAISAGRVEGCHSREERVYPSTLSQLGLQKDTCISTYSSWTRTNQITPVHPQGSLGNVEKLYIWWTLVSAVLRYSWNNSLTLLYCVRLNLQVLAQRFVCAVHGVVCVQAAFP